MNFERKYTIFSVHPRFCFIVFLKHSFSVPFQLHFVALSTPAARTNTYNFRSYQPSNWTKCENASVFALKFLHSFVWFLFSSFTFHSRLRFVSSDKNIFIIFFFFFFLIINMHILKYRTHSIP